MAYSIDPYWEAEHDDGLILVLGDHDPTSVHAWRQEAADEAEDVVDVEDVVDAVATNSNSREDRASISEHPQIPASNSRPRRTPTSDTRTKTIASRTVLTSLAVTTAEIATARCQTINTPPHEEMQWAARPRRRTKQLCQVAV